MDCMTFLVGWSWLMVGRGRLMVGRRRCMIGGFFRLMIGCWLLMDRMVFLVG